MARFSFIAYTAFILLPYLFPTVLGVVSAQSASYTLNVDGSFIQCGILNAQIAGGVAPYVLGLNYGAGGASYLYWNFVTSGNHSIQLAVPAGNAFYFTLIDLVGNRITTDPLTAGVNPDTNQAACINAFINPGSSLSSTSTTSTSAGSTSSSSRSISLTSSPSMMVPSTSTASSSTLFVVPTASASAMSASMSLAPNNNLFKSSSSTNTGAIVGGAVGGVVLLVLVAGTIFFCVRRKRRRDGWTNPNMSQTDPRVAGDANTAPELAPLNPSTTDTSHTRHSSSVSASPYPSYTPSAYQDYTGSNSVSNYSRRVPVPYDGEMQEGYPGAVGAGVGVGAGGVAAAAGAEMARYHDPTFPEGSTESVTSGVYRSPAELYTPHEGYGYGYGTTTSPHSSQFTTSQQHPAFVAAPAGAGMAQYQDPRFPEESAESISETYRSPAAELYTIQEDYGYDTPTSPNSSQITISQQHPSSGSQVTLANPDDLGSNSPYAVVKHGRGYSDSSLASTTAAGPSTSTASQVSSGTHTWTGPSTTAFSGALDQNQNSRALPTPRRGSDQPWYVHVGGADEAPPPAYVERPSIH